MKRVNCIIVDDEPLAAKVLENYIQRLVHLNLVGKAENAVEAFDLINTQWIDLMFLDIKMPQISGLDFIRSLSRPPAVIFTTAYRDFALEGFEMAAVDYLLKPISFERFMKAIGKVELPWSKDNVPLNDQEAQTFARDYIFVREDKRMKKVLLSDILFIESIKDYVKIIIKKGSVLTYLKMNYLEENLASHQFMRVHKSFIVSIEAIQGYSATEIEIGNSIIPIGRYYKNQVHQRLSDLLL
ncbi:two component transcriptional regulator, LytTR family [Reichenbachiella faecimaris]|uniref:Two component transcriptional regulator, LytTR family n=1 Tax=Reichenbachiella faecimaris TaxID=692418 RepID=A0A1W2GKW4_REIFA|nr:LytTR family DNA-binding domain-containing protein [Reichenbachiella faecimaris]SMD37295.1 two component transcriptional regulator, LytTR family [Reichenbachiella faecimaris]